MAMRTYLYYHMLFIHSLPFVGVLFNVIFSRIVFIPGHCVYLSLTGLCYCVVNFLGVKYRGHVLYPFLPWTDYKSVIISLGIVIAASVIYMTVCLIIKAIKQLPRDYPQSKTSFNNLEYTHLKIT